MILSSIKTFFGDERSSCARRGRRHNSSRHGVDRLEARRLLSTSAAYVHLNQVGYLPNDSKQAVLMASGPETGATFQVRNASGTTVFSATIGAKLGAWSNSFPDTYLLDCSSVSTPGTYSVVVHGPIAASSPQFAIGTGSDLYKGLLANELFFYQSQHDGPNVNSKVMDRQPSHLNDESAVVHSTNGDQVGKVIGGPVNVSGGWFDAGDYLKFVETASYTDAAMLLAVRDYPSLFTTGSCDLLHEAKYGLDWLQKMWNDKTKTLYYQVGIGADTTIKVNGHNITYTGDHNVWRLPQGDDRINLTQHPEEKFLKKRPVFEAGPPDSPISPNLAGRLAADFALGYQIFHASNPTYADTLIRDAEDVFDRAKTTHVGTLTTAFSGTDPPYYPEQSWQDDMELGATELYLATALGKLPSGLPHTNPSYFLTKAATYAKAYSQFSNSNFDTLNLYDVSGLAHYELVHAITQAGDPSRLAVTIQDLEGNLQEQLDTGVSQAATDPFGLGEAYSPNSPSPTANGDLVPHALGNALEASLYDDLTGTTKYAVFGQSQLDWVLGDNAWGTTFIVGAGTTFPLALASQIPNLVGTLNGKPPILLGAVVDGPTDPGTIASDLSEGPLPPGLDGQPAGNLPTTPDAFKQFSGQGVEYIDNPLVPDTSEPADDYAALTFLLFAGEVDGPPAAPP